jgi:uncharacterized protein (DUF58 family)
MPGARSAIRLGLALLFVGAAFDLPTLYVPGLALGLIAGIAMAWVEASARGMRLERLPGATTVVEGDPYPLRLRLLRALPPPPGGELRDPLLDEPLRLRGTLPERFEVEVRFPRRGRRRPAPATLVVSDPLGLHSRQVRSAPGSELLVLPRIEPVEAAGGPGGISGRGAFDGLERGAAAGAQLDVAALDVEIDGVRPYREGAPASRIHWPTAARTGELFERRLVSGAGSAPLVILDARNSDDADALDMAVRAAASLSLHLARAIGCSALIPGESRALDIDRGLAAWAQAHARFAVVEAGMAPPPILRPSRAGVYLVTAGEPDRRSAGTMRLAANSSFLVAPTPLPGIPTLFTVAGCSGQRLGASSRRQLLAGARAA